MSERARITYLECLGIESFVPRVILPYAPESDLCIDSELDESSLVEEGGLDAQVGATSMRAGESLAGDLINSLKREAATPKVKKAPLTVVSPASRQRIGENESAEFDSAPAAQARAEATVGELAKSEPSVAGEVKNAEPTERAENTEKLEFSLAIWRTAAPLLVIDSHRQGAAFPTERLLINMLRHSVWKSPRLSPCQHQHWPLLGLQPEHSGWQGAKEMLDCFFEGIVATQQIDCLWLMGEEAYRAANGEQAKNERPFQDVCFTETILRNNSARAVILPSLADILEQPLIKSKIWPLIQ